MKYMITYMDNKDNSVQLAHEIWEALAAEERKLISLPDSNMDAEMMDADVYCICFDYNRNVIPLEVIELLMELEGKRFAFFVTSGFAYADHFRDRLEHDLKAFFPDTYDYSGIFLCGGKFPDTVVKSAEEVLKSNPENAWSKFVLNNHEKTMNHPDAGDITELWDFLRQNMNL